jgi:hypothetical protein
MRTPPKLSSSLTFVSEWLFPAGFLAGLFAHIHIALRDPEYPIAALILWGIGSIVILIYSWQIKRVTIEDDYFVISNYFTTHRAPIAHLARVNKSYFSRGPMIVLYFEPSGPFGKRVRIIPGDGFDEIMAFLQSLISKSERP